MTRKIVQRLFRHPDGSVIPIHDSPLPSVLKISARAIERGIPNDPRHCVIAEAGHEVLGTEMAVVWKTVAMFEVPEAIGRPRHMIRFTLPAHSQKFIRRVDAGKTVEPTDIALNAPVGRQRIGADHRREEYGTRSQRRANPSRKPVWAGPRGNYTLRFVKHAS